MGTYHVVADVRARYENEDEVAHQTDATDSIGIGDDDVLNEIIDRTEGFMNSYFARRYSIPVAITGTSLLNAAPVKSVGLDIVRWHLQARHQRLSDATQVVYDEAKLWLEGIANGDVLLPVNLTSPSTISREPLGTIGNADEESSTSNRFFTRDRMKAV